jgi:hypothetical protein
VRSKYLLAQRTVFLYFVAGNHAIATKLRRKVRRRWPLLVRCITGRLSCALPCS